MVGHLLKYSKRPLLVAGHGVRLAGVQKELLQALHKYRIPVVTTFNGFDLVPSNHSCFVGRIGTLGTYGGNNALKNCDYLICLGTRNNIRQISFSYASFAPQATKIIVDIDEAELLKPTVQGIKLRESVYIFLNDWLREDCKLNIDSDWLSKLKKYDKVNPIELTPPYKFIHDLTSLLSEDAVVVCGNGTACVCMFQAGIVKRGQRIFWNSGCAAMGYDLPAAIGACFANNRKEVICITGDGSLQMNIQELQTIKHYNLPIKIFVLNNDGYQSIKMTQDSYFNGDYIGCNKENGVSFPRLLNIASAYGLNYFNTNWRPTKILDFNPIAEVLKRGNAVLCEVPIGNDYKFSPKWTGGYNG